MPPSLLHTVIRATAKTSQGLFGLMGAMGPCSGIEQSAPPPLGRDVAGVICRAVGGEPVRPNQPVKQLGNGAP